MNAACSFDIPDHKSGKVSIHVLDDNSNIYPLFFWFKFLWKWNRSGPVTYIPFNILFTSLPEHN